MSSNKTVGAQIGQKILKHYKTCPENQPIFEYFYTDYIYLILAVPGILFVIILSFLQKRKWLWIKFLKGRPGLPCLVNLVEHHTDRSIFVASFFLIGGIVSQAINGGCASLVPFLSQIPIYIKAPVILLAYVLCGVAFYPVVGALSFDHPISYFVGTLYTYCVAIILALTRMTYPCGNQVGLWLLLTLSYLPFTMAVVYLAIILPWKFIDSLRTKLKPNFLLENKELCGYEYEYVKKLLCPGLYECSPAKRRLIVKKIESFRHSIMAVPNWFEKFRNEPSFPYSLAFLGAISFSIAFIWNQVIANIYWVIEPFNAAIKYFDHSMEHLMTGESPYMDIIAETMVKVKKSAMVTISRDDVDVDREREYWTEFSINVLHTLSIYFEYLRFCVYFSVVVGSFAVIISLVFSIRDHKRHLILLYKGNRQENVCRYRSIPPEITMALSLKFIGYQISFAIWAVIVWIVTLVMVTFPIALLVMLAIHKDDHTIVTTPLLYIIATLFWFVLVIVLQKYICQLFFVQKIDGKPVLALDNRRLFFNLQYFTMFINAVVGMVTCLKRLLCTLGFGLWSLPRLDLSTMNQCFEKNDNGFMAYVGLLNMQNSISNPCMIVFSRFLHDKSENNNNDPQKVRRSKIVRNRWLTAVTLLNNPWLRNYRKKSLAISKESDIPVSAINRQFMKELLANTNIEVVPVIPKAQSIETATIASEIESVNGSVDPKERAIERIENELFQLQKEYDSLNEAHEQLKSEILKQKERTNEIIEESNEIITRTVSAQEQASKWHKRTIELKESINELNDQLFTLKSENKHLKSQLADAKKYKSQLDALSTKLNVAEEWSRHQEDIIRKLSKTEDKPWKFQKDEF